MSLTKMSLKMSQLSLVWKLVSRSSNSKLKKVVLMGLIRLVLTKRSAFGMLLFSPIGEYCCTYASVNTRRVLNASFVPVLYRIKCSIKYLFRTSTVALPNGKCYMVDDSVEDIGFFPYVSEAKHIVPPGYSYVRVGVDMYHLVLGDSGLSADQLSPLARVGTEGKYCEKVMELLRSAGVAYREDFLFENILSSPRSVLDAKTKITSRAYDYTGDAILTTFVAVVSLCSNLNAQLYSELRSTVTGNTMLRDKFSQSVFAKYMGTTVSQLATTTIGSDACEVLIGAVFMSGGFPAVICILRVLGLWEECVMVLVRNGRTREQAVGVLELAASVLGTGRYLVPSIEQAPQATAQATSSGVGTSSVSAAVTSTSLVSASSGVSVADKLYGVYGDAIPWYDFASEHIPEHLLVVVKAIFPRKLSYVKFAQLEVFFDKYSVSSMSGEELLTFVVKLNAT